MSDDVPEEAEMRKQMFRTMCAFEKMANAVTDHLTADKQPCETATDDPVDYGSIRVQCRQCKGVVQFNDYLRDPNSGHDTCSCGDGNHVIDLPDYVKARFMLSHAMGAERQHRQTARLIEDDVVIRGNVTVEGDLMVKGTTASIETQSVPGPIEPLPTSVEVLQRMVNDHHRALAMIVTFGQFKDIGFFGTKPDRAIASLIKLKACKECVGTGWIARDESCKICNSSGYIES